MDYLSNIDTVITRHRGKIINVTNLSGNILRIHAEIPVAESADLANELRGASAGRAFWGTEFSRWAPVPESLLWDLVRKIRERKGLKTSPQDLKTLCRYSF